MPIRIWFGPPEEDGEPLDRSPRWQVEINGIPFGDWEAPPTIAGRAVETLEGIWPQCMSNPIDEAEYRYRVDRAEYAESYDPADPFARTGGRVDPMTARLPFSD